MKRKEGRVKKNTKANQTQAACKVSQCAWLLLHLCWRSVKTRIFFFRALWHLSHTRSAHRTFSRSEGSMESESAQVWPFYFGRIGSQATERLLERFGQEGSFLLRDSDTVQGLYCLCVRWAVNTAQLYDYCFTWALCMHRWRRTVDVEKVGSVSPAQQQIKQLQLFHFCFLSGLKRFPLLSRITLFYWKGKPGSHRFTLHSRQTWGLTLSTLK